MYIMAGLLVVGFICNYFVRAIHEKYYASSLTEAMT
jgi:hypothetical protein